MKDQNSLMPERDAIWAKHDGLTPALAAEMLAFAGRMEQERNEARSQLEMARASAVTFRQCAEITFGTVPFPRKFHWENSETVQDTDKNQ
jgi:hypothetical protein